MLLLKRKKARLNKIAIAEAKLNDKNSEQVNETKTVEPEATLTNEVKESKSRSRKLWKKMFLRTAIFRSNKSNAKLQPEVAEYSTTENETVKTSKRKILNRLLLKSTAFRSRKGNVNSVAGGATNISDSSKITMEFPQSKQGEGPDNKKHGAKAMKTLAFTLHRGEAKVN